MTRPLSNRKLLIILGTLTVALVLCAPLIRPFEVAAAQTQDQTQYYNREFDWDFGGNHWIWNLSIPVALYNAYVAVPDSVRTQISLSDFGYFTTTYDLYLQNLASKINATATQQGYTPYQEVNFALAFVQSIPYATDYNSTGYQDYPRFPVETLVDNVGDCKSHSILFATLTLMLGYDVVYINPPDHLAVGILGNNLQGTYWTYNNQTYYYCETTGEGFTIGQLPTEFNGQTAYVYPIDTSKQYIVNIQTSTDQNSPTWYSFPEATPNGQPNPINTPMPTLPGPTIQPVQPISLNLIANSPILFTLIIAAIAASIAVAIKSTKITKEKRSVDHTSSLKPESSNPASEQAASEKNKFCIYCGSNNKSVAVYCENCGKKIA